jgi:hypothetical protein
MERYLTWYSKIKLVPSFTLLFKKWVHLCSVWKYLRQAYIICFNCLCPLLLMRSYTILKMTLLHWTLLISQIPRNFFTEIANSKLKRYIELWWDLNPLLNPYWIFWKHVAFLSTRFSLSFFWISKSIPCSVFWLCAMWQLPRGINYASLLWM